MNGSESNILDLKPDLGNFRSEFLRGMTSSPKELNPKFFYDEAGSRLFDEITGLDEYYPTRTEISILKSHCKDLSDISSTVKTVIELGSGNGEKGEILINCMPYLKKYVFVDISASSLEEALRSGSSKSSNIVRKGIRCDFSTIDRVLSGMFPETKLLVFLGSTLGNMEPAEVDNFLLRMAKVLNTGDLIALGVDLRKDIRILEAAYNDSKGVTAKFNLNIIRRAQRELHVPLNVDDFTHLAFYNEKKSRIEMHLVSRKNILFEMDGVKIVIKKGETIHTENSYKYSADELSDKLERAGFHDITVWKDPGANFAIINGSK